MLAAGADQGSTQCGVGVEDVGEFGLLPVQGATAKLLLRVGELRGDASADSRPAAGSDLRRWWHASMRAVRLGSVPPPAGPPTRRTPCPRSPTRSAAHAA